MASMESPHVVNWFEIPVTDLSRAEAFYGEVLGATFEHVEMGSYKMAVFQTPKAETYVVHGGLMKGEGYVPSEQGTLVYLNGGKDLNTPLAKVEKAGGAVVTEKTSIGEHGYIAVFKDSEGNRMALHSPE